MTFRPMSWPKGVTEGDILEIDNNQPNYPIPMPQVMARQEPTRSA